MKEIQKLVLPCNKYGRLNGDALRIPYPGEDYKYSPCFEDRDSHTTFRCPSQGATTENSKSPRSEVVWDHRWTMGTGRRTSRMRFRINAIQFDDDMLQGRTVIGQCRAPNGKELCKVYFGDGDGDLAEVWVKDELARPEIMPFANPATVKIGRNSPPIEVLIDVRSRSCRVTVSQGDEIWYKKWSIHSDWRTAKGMNFSAGIYNVGDKGSGWTEVDMYEWKCTR